MVLLILFLSLHYPFAMIFCVLLLALFRLHLLFHLKRFWDIQAPLDRWPLINSIHPLLHVLKLVEVYTGPLGPVHPGEACEVCDRAFRTYDPGSGRAGWLGLESQFPAEEASVPAAATLEVAFCARRSSRTW